MIGLAGLFFCLSPVGGMPLLYAYPLDGIQQLLGKEDAVIIASPQGKTIFEKNPDKNLIPASTLKIFTSLVALYFLGSDYRFQTEFYLGPDNNLKIKGYGDPLLISETLLDIANKLSRRVVSYNDLELDDAFFLNPIHIPGTSPTYQPYDAPNGALCVNFNTVNFKRYNETYVSAENQTPLLPFVVERIKASSLNYGRIILTSRNNESTLYAGHLFKYFLSEAGVESNGDIKIGRVQKQHDRLLLTYVSPFSLQQVITKLLEFSNNFIANQLLLTAGAKRYGPPGTLDKGIQAALSYASRNLGIQDLSLIEGSGISRENRISARNMLKILNEFMPYHELLRQQDSEFYKTGTLTGITTRAGYLANDKGELYQFVIMINTPGTSIQSVMKQVRRSIKSLNN
jgi:D-alanyl-D-alanine carboxypeptidase/D-alanyl-D-alanine-endopeptidase (penicillin-binding protein 4)